MERSAVPVVVAGRRGMFVIFLVCGVAVVVALALYSGFSNRDSGSGPWSSVHGPRSPILSHPLRSTLKSDRAHAPIARTESDAHQQEGQPVSTIHHDVQSTASSTSSTRW